MKKIIDNLELLSSRELDCQIKTLQVALNHKKLNYSLNDIVLDSNAIRFDFKNINRSGLPINMILGSSSTMIMDFASNTNVDISYYTGLSDEEDFQAITDAISNSNCVMAITDRTALLKMLKPKLTKNLLATNIRPYHAILIYGVDTDKKKFLVCDLSTMDKKYHALWIDAEKLNSTRKGSFLDISINNDIYIIENCSGFKKTDSCHMLNKQIGLWRDSLVASESEFDKTYSYILNSNESDSKQERYLNVQTNVAVMSTSFDSSRTFYRNSFYEIFLSYYKGNSKDKLTSEIEDIVKIWKDFCFQVGEYRGKYTHKDILHIWNMINSAIKKETAFCSNFLSYNNTL